MNSIPRDASAPTTPVSAASLPPELRKLVDQVLKRCRLWPAERKDVEAELAAHFADGLAAGQSVQELMAQFGDANAAAGLISRAKIRLRPRSWHARRIVVRTTLAAAGLAIAVYGGLFARFFVGTPTITRDIRQEINAPILAIPANQRAWSKYAQALAAINIPKREKETDESGATLPPLNAFDSIESARANQAGIKLVREAAALPSMGYVVDDPASCEFVARQTERLNGNKGWQTSHFSPPDASGPAYGILLPQLAVFRNFARLLAQDVDLALQAGDGAAAGADLVAMARLAGQLRETKFLIVDLVSLAVGDLAMSKMREVLTRNPSLLSDQTLDQFAAALSAIGPRQDLVRLDSELLGFDDVLQRSFTDDGRGDGRLTPAGIRLLSQMSMGSRPENNASVGSIALLPVAATVGPGRKQVRDLYVQYLNQTKAWAERPAWLRGEATDFDAFAKLSSNEVSPFSFVALLIPAFRQTVFAADRFDTSRAATQTVIAIERFKRRTGHLPTSLDQLVPGDLPALPRDLVDGQPLRYRTSGASYTLYSLGSDRKDNGGTPPTTESDASGISNFNWPIDASKVNVDWVFFPFTKPAKTAPVP
ncbi:MAG: hypothetical protein U0570_09405 [Phycisphaerales bacterium]